MYVLFHLEMWCTALWFCKLRSNYDRAYMIYFAGCGQFWTYMKLCFLSFHIVYWVQNMMLMKVNLNVFSWIFIFSKLLIFCSSIPPILKRPTPPTMNIIFMPKCISNWVWLSISSIRMPVIRDFWNWLVCTVNQNRSKKYFLLGIFSWRLKTSSW